MAPSVLLHLPSAVASPAEFPLASSTEVPLVSPTTPLVCPVEVQLSPSPRAAPTDAVSRFPTLFVVFHRSD